MLVIFPVFKISNNGSYVYVVILTLMQGVAGMSFGILIRVKTLTIEIKTIVFLM
jgi:hypothetical protein